MIDIIYNKNYVIYHITFMKLQKITFSSIFFKLNN